MVIKVERAGQERFRWKIGVNRSGNRLIKIYFIVKYFFNIYKILNEKRLTRVFSGQPHNIPAHAGAHDSTTLAKGRTKHYPVF